ncbi:16S rRNA (cytosine(1402)-N(4))-methyltransferase RsmH [Umboniibacter marinipuniceus]|uniref:Ribosomal RNA small subunit methyltransferase H n=1 Tax=Umboniibacter marinipuniceus TaxID=569599 RepID=A0A3M0AG13_9GAMM|nr:16S rRNA (cytosine(1402)-N(4))-methyltransferase RsmH [Umboniibacter marinipuniceus]RMA81445.1 16S rRNA (cytosine1402-N4)-methyltransferase [Umboniibacter marinipuniceus]
MTNTSHYSVLLSESVEALAIKADGVYVDGTFGRGGHSRKILDQLGPKGRLIAFDKDPQAIDFAATHFNDERFYIHHGSFTEMSVVIAQLGLSGVDGILLDLGVSSPQLDQAERGFSFMKNGPLDMRMDTSRGQSAADWLAVAEHGEMASVFRRYGEEKFSGPIASGILRAREKEAITTTSQLAKVIEDSTPKKDRNKHPATRVFQAIRIFVNNELGDVEDVLEQSVNLLNFEGRLVVISFHSLEDRIAKHFIRDKSKGKKIPKGVPVMGDAELGPLAIESKAIKASTEEVAENARSRSAVMRVASKRVE